MLDAIRKKHGLSLIILHGSQVDGKIHPQSDCDIAVLGEDGTSEPELLELIYDLSKALSSDQVDVLRLNHADPLSAFAVARKSKLLAGKRQDYDKFLKRAFMRYGDYLPYLDREREFVKEKLRRHVSN